MKTHTLFDLRDFRSLMSSARRVAELAGEKEVLPQHLAISAVVLFAGKEPQLNVKPEVMKELETLTTDIPIDRTAVAEPPASKDLPLAEPVREVIQRCKTRTLNQFMEELRGKLQEDHDRSSKPENFGFGNAEPHAVVLLRHASSLAKRNGLDVIVPWDIATAAYQLGAYFRSEGLKDVSHVLTHHRFLHAVMGDVAEVRLVDIDTCAEILNRSEATQKKITAAIKDSATPLIAFLNGCLAEVGKRHQKLLTAYHEAGHAVLAMLLTPERTIERVSIKTEDGNDGLVSFEDQNFWSIKTDTGRDYFCAAQILMAGRIAETIVDSSTSGLTSGSYADIEQATDYLSRGIYDLGMNKRVGFLAVDPMIKRAKGFSVTGLIAEWQVRRESRRAYKLAEKLVRKHWAAVDRVAKALLEKETLLLRDLLELV